MNPNQRIEKPSLHVGSDELRKIKQNHSFSNLPYHSSLIFNLHKISTLLKLINILTIQELLTIHTNFYSFPLQLCCTPKNLKHPNLYRL